MRLIVTTPLAVIADASDITHLRAEDETGAFGILPGHADFLTALSVSVATTTTRGSYGKRTASRPLRRPRKRPVENRRRVPA